MGTSNWQNIPFCIDALMKIEPQRVLDIGVGFGRWGVTVREFCDVWFGRVLPENWTVHIEGVEGFAPNIRPYHQSFYNQVHIGDFRQVVRELEGIWDVVIFGDVLEHFEKGEALGLLEWALAHSAYVLVNIPLGDQWPQEELYENDYERHLSTWRDDEFAPFGLRQHRLFEDFAGRPFGSFVLSREDPRGLAKGLFSRQTQVHTQDQGENQNLDVDQMKLVHTISAALKELRDIKASRSYRVTRRLLRSPFAGALLRLGRWALPDSSGGPLRAMARWRPTSRPRENKNDGIHLEVLEEQNPDSQGQEIWLLDINPGQTPAVDLVASTNHQGWVVKTVTNTGTGKALVSYGRNRLDITRTDVRSLRFLTHPWSGVVRIRHKHTTTTVDLFDAAGSELTVDLTDGIVVSRNPAPLSNSGPTIARKGRALSQVEQALVERVSRSHGPVSICHPEWRGIRSSASQLFDENLFIGDDLNEDSGEHFAKLLADSGCSAVILQGFPLTYTHLVTALARLAPKLPVYEIWHGSFLQSSEDYAWSGFQLVRALHEAGRIRKWGFVKHGMAEIMAKLGYRTGFVMNCVRKVPDGPSTPLAGGPHVGIWGVSTNWRKPPYSMLAAASTLTNITVHASGLDARAMEFASLVGLDVRAHPGMLLPNAMASYLGQMDVNLYATLSECAPMLPLESLSAGTPCVFGPNSHYFRDHEYLSKALIVSQPDSAHEIARVTAEALANRAEIIRHYAAYAPGYNQRAMQSLESFLDLDLAEK